MKLRNLLLAIPIVLLIASCTGLKVVADVDSTVDFSQYKTFQYYGWKDGSDKHMSEFDKDRIESAFGKEFKMRNLEYVKDGGDLVVTLFIVVKERLEKVANTTHMGGYGGYYGGYYGYGPGWGAGVGYSTTTVQEYNYKEGTIVVDVFDAKEKKLIWEGIGTKTIEEDPKGRSERITYVVNAIMKKYPVKPVKK